MSLLLFPSTGPSAAVTPGLAVPTLHARVAWRGYGLTYIDWDGTSTTGWTTDGSSLSAAVTSLGTTASDSFGGGSCLEVVTTAGATSGIDWDSTATAVSGREYRFRVGLRNISGSTSATLRLGNAADYNDAAITLTSEWAWYTVDWTPSADRTDAVASLRNGAAATQTTRLDHAEVYEKDDEVTLQSLRVTRGSRFDGTSERPGTIDFSVLDPDEVYSPRNSSSPLYGYVTPGCPVHIRATFEGRLYAIAYGTVRSVTPDPTTKLVTFTCEDGLAELEDYTIAREFASDGAAYAARAAALSAEALAADQHDLATDSVEASTFTDGTDRDVSLLSYLADINEATGTLHFCKPYVEAIRPWRYTTITRATLTNDVTGHVIDEDFQRLSGVSIRDESFITRQRVSWVGYERLASQVVCEATAALPYWTYTNDEFGSTDRPEPEDIYRLKRNRKTRRRIRRKVGTRWLNTAVPIAIANGETVERVVDFSVPMQDVSVSTTDDGNVTTVLTVEPARVTIAMTASADDEVTAIEVTATPHLPLDEAEEVVDTAGATVVREGRPLDSEKVPSKAAAGGMADYLTWRYGTARLRPGVTDQHDMARQLSLDVGSHVTLSADRWHIDADRYVVRAIEVDVSRGGLEWETTYGLEELPSGGDWFTLDGSAAQGLGGSAVLAH